LAQTKAGALKAAAGYYGLTVEELVERLKTQSYCNKCKTWQLRDQFGVDRSTLNGLKKNCFTCRRVTTPKDLKGRPSSFKGHTHTEEARRKMGIARIGNKNRVGKPNSMEVRQRQSEFMRQHAKRGADNPMWKGGVTLQNDRHVPEYRIWRRAVYERDNYICQQCGDSSGANLHAHHIQSFAAFPDLRFVVSNGLTVCDLCHRHIHGRPVTNEDIFCIQIAVLYNFDSFGSWRALAKASGLSVRAVQQIARREGRFANEDGSSYRPAPVP
jgi:hypothetical protein